MTIGRLGYRVYNGIMGIIYSIVVFLGLASSCLASVLYLWLA